MQSLARFSLANRALIASVTIFVLAFGLLSTVERGAGAQAERLIGGLFSSTVLTLVLVPVLYTLIERARGWHGRRHGGRRHAGQHAAA
jgi:Cu/Ag efflux pump CusA